MIKLNLVNTLMQQAKSKKVVKIRKTIRHVTVYATVTKVNMVPNIMRILLRFSKISASFVSCRYIFSGHFTINIKLTSLNFAYLYLCCKTCLKISTGRPCQNRQTSQQSLYFFQQSQIFSSAHSNFRIQ